VDSNRAGWRRDRSGALAAGYAKKLLSTCTFERGVRRVLEEAQ
jgi:hypothetical protein